MPTIDIIPSHQINKTKWDNCVANSINGLVYAHSYYLDAMANEWHGLVVNDYETILPIAIKKKFGFAYSYMPAFVQQLGFIGNQLLHDEKVVKAVFSFVKYGSPYLNFGNAEFATKHNCPRLNNYTINLNNSYEAIKSSYKKTIDYSLVKAAKAQLQYVADKDITHAVQLYKSYNQHNMQHTTNTDYSNLQNLLLQQSHQVMIRKALNTNNDLLSIVLLLKDNKRYYNLINYTTPEGRKTEANYFLYDNILKELASQPMLFDFEGSDLPGVKAFYEKFGAANQPYFHWHFNHLPFPLKLFKP